MSQTSNTASPDALAIASAAVVAALLDTLAAKGLLSNAEIRGALNAAMTGVGARTTGNLTASAGSIIAGWLRGHPEKRV